MIKLLSIIALTIILSFTPDINKQQKQKDNVYTLTEGQMIILYNTNVQVKQILPTSQAPAIQVTNLTMGIDSIQNVLTSQYKSFHPDTTVSKKN